MPVALKDSRALTTGELARAASIAPPTASGHLARLTEARLLAVSDSERNRYFCIALRTVAQMKPKPIVTGPKNRALRHARICYDHLAGERAARHDHTNWRRSTRSVFRYTLIGRISA
jgi:DNA-binding transcriptional ArsR family regulator